MNSLSYPVAGLFGLGGPELLLIFAVIMLLFGAKRLPELAKGLGKSIKEFKKASHEADQEINAAQDDPEAKPAAASKPETAATKAHHGTN